MHYRHLESGAQMLQAGAWYRPAYYGKAPAREDCIQREVDNVRNNVGLIDVSTLGGIEVRGVDAIHLQRRRGDRGARARLAPRDESSDEEL